MLCEERRRAIVELLQTDGRVLVGDLAKRFHTSLITIRKDLEFLHHLGQLERTIVVCDSSKFGRRSLSLILPPSAVHETITDKGILKRDLKALRTANVEVTLV
jgi:DeoR/GlpR family transcriptional regulator of sugar metabolism